MNKKLAVFGVLSFGLVLTGCTTHNVWDEDYDLGTEMGRELHCSAMFQKADVAELKGTYWVAERNVENTYLVEGKMETDKGDYYTTCIYPQGEGDWNISISPADNLSESINPAIQYCLSQKGDYSIEYNDTSIFGVCLFEDSSSCNAWEFYYGVCSPSTEGLQETNLAVLTSEDRVAACEDRAGFYLNFGTGTFVWHDEIEDGNTYLMTGNVVYEKGGEKGVADIDCTVDMLQRTVNVEFSNHTALEDLEVE